MSIFEYDEELHKRTLRKEGYEEGLEQGMLQGMKQGRKQGMEQAVLELLEGLGSVPEDIKKRVLLEKNLEILKKWHKAAAKAESMEQFRADI